MFGNIPNYDMIPLDDDAAAANRRAPPPAADRAEPNLDDANRVAILAWQERQRRQRTLRSLMMFLMILLLMDGDEPPNNRRTPASRNNLRNRNDKNRYQLENWEYALTPEVHRARSHEDKLISLAVKTNLNSRYHELTKKNGRDIEGELRELVAKKLKEEVAKSMIVDGESESRDGNKGSSTLTDKEISTERDDEETMASSQEQSTLSSDTSVLHYPRNATGYYRGLWLQTNINKTISIDDDEDQSQGLPRKVTPKEMIPWAQTQLQHRQADVSLLLLPPNVYIEPDTTNSENSTSEDNRDVTAGKGETDARYTSSSTPKLSLTREAGRAAFQLYYRPIPAMNELSIVDGLVKLYDGMTTSFVSRRTDVLLQVRGVMIHSIGKMSLVTLSPGTETQRSLLAVRKVIKNNHAEELHLDEAKKNLINDEVDLEGADENDEEEATDRRRRLQWTISDLLSRSDSHESFESEKALIRQEVMHLYSSYYLDNDDVLDLESAAELKGWTRLQSNDEGFSDDDEHHLHFPSSRRIQQTTHENDDYVDTVGVEKNSLSADVNSSSTYDMLSNELLNVGETRNGTEVSWHRSSLVASPDQLAPIQYVYPYPYVMDDDEGTIQKSSSPATRRLPGREQALEANGANCEFEINLDVQATKWTVGEWRLSLEHRMRMGEVFNPHLNISHSAIVQLKRSQYLLMLKSQLDFLEKQIPREALVMTLTGDIESKNCDFSSFINVTAMRTNWENTTAKAINYSFYMMLTCLTQIVILLRQLLHTQTQSVASNVSLLCIGWQTVLDAIICICHIFLCLVMQPLFTAFASVAFFKLLIFCIIELKYMAIIIQARNSANNTSLTQEDLRRQITLLHLKFYSALVLAIVAFWYVGQSNRSLFILLLYSFWVPQIILNIITEARKPLHPYFLYGMSLTRSVAPIYVFAVRNNFLREVNPDFPLEPRMCQMLIVWISIQTATLYAQAKYGTRFMIPQRFLPPKFDYSRPIPPSLLPRLANNPPSGPTPEIELAPLINGDASPAHTGVARNRRGGGANRSRLGSRADDVPVPSMCEDTTATQTLDCVICYNDIDISDRNGYMLAPCDHIFHRQCLVQWMEVKMQCPICRCNLPSI